MNGILAIAASGAIAAATRLQVSADNVANANSDGPLPTASAVVQSQYPQVYTPQQVDQVTLSDGGTAAIVSNVQPAYTAAYAPTAPYADSNGEVAQPNVDYANEAVTQATAAASYAMNVQVMRVYSQMMQTLLDIQT